MNGAGPIGVGSLFADEYRIEGLLGRGGMGDVYVAEQLATGAKRALKLMRRDFAADERLLGMFVQEAKIGHLIRSAHVVQVIDAGIDAATGVPWLSMELLEGQTLAEHVDRTGPLAPETVAVIFAQLCHALAAAHEQGIVHRDIKPENIFLASSWREGIDLTVKVLDFGIAKIVEATGPSTMPIGTPFWMGPEQLLGHGVDARADVWALGLLGFWLLTGRSYWQSVDVPPEAAKGQLLKDLLYNPLVSASARAAEYGRDAMLPAGFDAWFSRCVTRDVIARFPNAGVVRAELEAILRASRPPSRPPSQPPSSRPHLALWSDAETSEPSEIEPQAEGTLFDASWYVERKREQREALNYLRYPGKPAVVWGPSRLGKTWFLQFCLDYVRTRRSFQIVSVNMNHLETAAWSSLDKLLENLGAQITNSLDLPPESMKAAMNRPGGPTNKLSWLLERQVLPHVEHALVIALDGLDAVARSPFKDDVFTMLRRWAESTQGPWTRLRLMLAVSTAPAQLIDDSNRSPFNLTTPIELNDLDHEQVAGLAQRYRLPWADAEIDQIMLLVGGHPYLARMVMHRVALHQTPLCELLPWGLTPGGVLFGEVLRIRDWLKSKGVMAGALHVLENPGCRLDFDDHQRIVRAGVAVEGEGGGLRLRNRLYEIAVANEAG